MGLHLILPLLIASFLLTPLGTHAVAANTDDPFRAMSFNIRFDNPDDGPDAWPHRKEMVASMVRFHHADIVGTQEGLLHQLEEMDELLPDYEWVGVGRDDGGGEGEFSAIFYRTTRFDLLDHGTFWLSETPEEPGSVGWDAALPRIATWAEFHDQQTDQRFFVFNTHFDHRGEEARVNSARLILEKVAEIVGTDPLIVMGDLNATEDEEPYKIFAEADRGPAEISLSDGFYVSEHGHHGPTSTWNAFERIFPDRRIDYIFVDDHFSVIQHGILADIWDGHFPSDHLPVLAEIELRSQP